MELTWTVDENINEKFCEKVAPYEKLVKDQTNKCLEKTMLVRFICFLQKLTLVGIYTATDLERSVLVRSGLKKCHCRSTVTNPVQSFLGFITVE